ncbi:MAG: hypothetical protein WC677_08385 [Clostridia bacterium]|jgi:hypothetical protein
MDKLEFVTKQKKLKKHQDKFRNSFRYKKLIAEAVKTIIANDSLVFSKDDIKAISNKVYKRADLLVCGRVRSTLNQEMVKIDVNNELQKILNEAGLDKNKLKTIYETVEQIANDKKDGNLLLKIAEKIERANNLTENNSTRATYRETTDFSKLGKDGQPAQKVTKTLEITKNEAIRDDMSNDLDKVNDNLRPENS